MPPPLPILLVLAILATAPGARAEGKPADHETPAALGGTGCSPAGFTFATQSFSPAFAIPDDGGGLVTVGEIPTVADSSEFLVVMLEVAMAHTWMGDLTLRLEYVDCESGLPLHGVDVICRPRGTNLLVPSPCGAGTSAGCSGNLGSSAVATPPPAPVAYLFSDSASAGLADGACPAVAPAGCYRAASAGALAGFAGLSKGACWRLLVADWAPADVGRIASWTMWMRTQPEVATLPMSWGRVKAIYR